jgi:hypothetical protein
MARFVRARADSDGAHSSTPARRPLFRGIGINPLAPGNTGYLLWMLMGFMVAAGAGELVRDRWPAAEVVRESAPSSARVGTFVSANGRWHPEPGARCCTPRLAKHRTRYGWLCSDSGVSRAASTDSPDHPGARRTAVTILSALSRSARAGPT